LRTPRAVQDVLVASRAERVVSSLPALICLHPELPSMSMCCRLIRCLFSLILAQDSVLNQRTNSAAQLHGIKPGLLTFSSGGHNAGRTVTMIENGVTQRSYCSVIA